MPKTGLRYGPYPLTSEEIEEEVTRASPGVYVLDKRNKEGTFTVNYVGRADVSVNKRLHQWVGSKYKRFKFDYSSSPKAAFEKECEIYHDFSGPDGKMDNDVHPKRPEGTNWQCPRCDVSKTQW